MEARFDDPTSSESSDSDQLLWDATTDTRGGIPRIGVVLAPNTSNPFNPRTEITSQLPAPTHAALQVFDMRGRVVRTLAAGSFGSGLQTFVWDGTNDAGAAVASGIYVYRLQSAGRSWARRMTLLK